MTTPTFPSPLVPTQPDSAVLAREQERVRLARELHDELGGNLTALKMGLALLAQQLREAGVAPALCARAEALDELAERNIVAVQQITLNLRPPVLELGLVAALAWQVRQFEQQAGIVCQLHTPHQPLTLTDEQTAALWRIAQEALTNIAKHADASRASVRLAWRGPQLRLTISDDGCGLHADARAKPSACGLRGMAERAQALGATLTLRCRRGGGTVVAVSLLDDRGRQSSPEDATIAMAASVAAPEQP